MEKTINFAGSLPLDMAKFDIAIPYPGTPYYQNDLHSNNRILNYNFQDYVVHQVDKPIFQHENLKWYELREYYSRAYREYSLNPGYILRRLKRSLFMGSPLYNFKYFVSSRWY